MKRYFTFLILITLLLCGCTSEPSAQIAATTLPVYEFTTLLCQGTDITVSRLITEPVSCLHDYSLNVEQVKAVEKAQLVVLSGAGLEDFMQDLLTQKAVIDSSVGLELVECHHDHDHEEDHGHDHSHGHDHEVDSHIWLDPSRAGIMARNICIGLTAQYPQYAEQFSANLEDLTRQLNDLYTYGDAALSELSCRDLITFHDGFGYLADAFDLHILEAVEEESGSEASARELKHLITLVREHSLPAIFTEANGSVSAAEVIARETGANTYTLDMAMGGDSYFDAMYHNIDMIKEALG